MTHGHGHGHGHGGEPLTPVEEHLAEILRTITPLTPTELGLGDVHGLVLAEDVSTVSPLPPFDNSGMDGYAVLVGDVADATAALRLAHGRLSRYLRSQGTISSARSERSQANWTSVRR